MLAAVGVIQLNPGGRVSSRGVPPAAALFRESAAFSVISMVPTAPPEELMAVVPDSARVRPAEPTLAITTLPEASRELPGADTVAWTFPVTPLGTKIDSGRENCIEEDPAPAVTGVGNVTWK
jgi:hypothetical protein